MREDFLFKTVSFYWLPKWPLEGAKIADKIGCVFLYLAVKVVARFTVSPHCNISCRTALYWRALQLLCNLHVHICDSKSPSRLWCFLQFIKWSCMPLAHPWLPSLIKDLFFRSRPVPVQLSNSVTFIYVTICVGTFRLLSICGRPSSENISSTLRPILDCYTITQLLHKIGCGIALPPTEKGIKLINNSLWSPSKSSQCSSLYARFYSERHIFLLFKH